MPGRHDDPPPVLGLLQPDGEAGLGLASVDLEVLLAAERDLAASGTLLEGLSLRRRILVQSTKATNFRHFEQIGLFRSKQ